MPRVIPKMAPRAYASQCGAPSPAKAGTMYTPPLSGTLAARASTRRDPDELEPVPQPLHRGARRRRHCPRGRTCGAPPRSQATVVSSRFFEATAERPVLRRRKQPVPYVFFAPGRRRPGRRGPPAGRRRCRRSARTRRRAPPSSTTLDEGTTCGRTFRGTSRSSSRSSSHVAGVDVEEQRAARIRGVGDVHGPTVSFQMSHVSIVPKASSPASARMRALARGRAATSASCRRNTGRGRGRSSRGTSPRGRLPGAPRSRARSAGPARRWRSPPGARSRGPTPRWSRAGW